MIRRTGHGKAVDWYLLGILIYEMITGIPPFYCNDKNKMMNNILNKPLRLPKFASSDARSILRMLLTKDPEKRLGSGKYDAKIVKSHRWFEGINWDKVYKRQLPVPKDIDGVKSNNDESDNHITSRLLRGMDEDKLDQSNHYIDGWSFHHENN